MLLQVKEHAMTKQKREMQETIFHLGYTYQISNRGQNKPPWNVITWHKIILLHDGLFFHSLEISDKVVNNLSKNSWCKGPTFEEEEEEEKRKNQIPVTDFAEKGKIFHEA